MFYYIALQQAIKVDLIESQLINAAQSKHNQSQAVAINPSKSLFVCFGGSFNFNIN
ncbi:MAG: hypothetical protein HRU38_22405 [Saccharospirillaceae bacterium]|nr:hypothetical protein [Saccharospirillaceae bacterium]